jgi:hypothetical protein
MNLLGPGVSARHISGSKTFRGWYRKGSAPRRTSPWIDDSPISAGGGNLRASDIAHSSLRENEAMTARIEGERALALYV